jgi:AcrR family transcriptional regulator
LGCLIRAGTADNDLERHETESFAFHEDTRCNREGKIRAARVHPKRRGEAVRCARLRWISVDDIAKKAGLAKGTVYLYFGTKEALFLELVAEQLESWVRNSTPQLKKAKATPAAIAAVVASSLSRRPVLIRLLSLMHAILERNTEITPLREFKRRLLHITTQSGTLFERALGLTPGTGIRLTLWMQATIVGLSQLTATSPTLERSAD